MCDGMQGDKEFHFSCQRLLEELLKTNQQPSNDGIYYFKFPGVSDSVGSIYWDILMSMERYFPIDDYFTNPELRKVVRVIDNWDYVNDVYPGQDVGWHGLLLDSGIFRGIARYKKQYDNPTLVGIELMCSALTMPTPKHLYYLKFEMNDGTHQTVSFRSGGELLEPVRS
jgi:hypothetical protein